MTTPWRAMITLAVLLGAGAVLLSVILFSRVQDAREDVVRIFCVSSNTERQKLRRLIVSGAESSRIFEDLFRKYGAPPFDARVGKARGQAATLYAIDCDQLARIARTGSSLKRPPRAAPARR